MSQQTDPISKLIASVSVQPLTEAQMAMITGGRVRRFAGSNRLRAARRQQLLNLGIEPVDDGEFELE